MGFSKTLGLLKFELFFHGIKVDKADLNRLSLEGYRVPAFVRTGASYGIEAIVEGTLSVNIPLNDASPICFSPDFCTLTKNDVHLCQIDILKNPISLSLKNEAKSTACVANICFDRLGLTLYAGCCFKEAHAGCNFCGINIVL